MRLTPPPRPTDLAHTQVGKPPEGWHIVAAAIEAVPSTEDRAAKVAVYISATDLPGARGYKSMLHLMGKVRALALG